MLRVVFASALAVVLVAATLPALEDASRSRAAAGVEGDLATLERAATSLLATDEAAPGAGPRRAVTVRVPERSWTNAGLAYVSIGGPPGERASESTRRGVVVYRVRGGEPRRLRLSVPLWTPGESVVLREAGTHRLTLTVDRVDGRRVVVVRRAG